MENPYPPRPLSNITEGVIGGYWRKFIKNLISVSIRHPVFIIIPEDLFERVLNIAINYVLVMGVIRI